MILKGERLSLKRLTPKDVNQDYLNWINDKELTQYMESRWNDYTLDDLKAYVKQLSTDKSNYLFGIYLNKSNKYIGNIKIGPIDPIHNCGDMGFIIGDKNSWGYGYATEAIEAAVSFAFTELVLNKITAGLYIENVGSLWSLKKNGFRKVGVFKKDRLYKGSYVDRIQLELLKEKWEG